MSNVYLNPSIDLGLLYFLAVEFILSYLVSYFFSFQLLDSALTSLNQS